MKANEQIIALIDAYIELAKRHSYKDSQIIDALTDIFEEDELVSLGYGEFLKDEVLAPEIDISKIAYELYKQDWVDEHTTREGRLQSIREYHDYVQECAEDGFEADSYEDWLFEVGYHGALYVCYDEFCDEEYHDVGYVKSLLGGDEVLLKKYYEDIDCAYEETEDLSVVSEVLSHAEQRYAACAAHESIENEFGLD